MIALPTGKSKGLSHLLSVDFTVFCPFSPVLTIVRNYEKTRRRNSAPFKSDFVFFFPLGQIAHQQEENIFDHMIVDFSVKKVNFQKSGHH